MRIVRVILLLTIVSGGCSESSIDVTAPGDAKCSVSVGGATTSFGADGGNGQLSVTTSRDCAWSAAAGAEWITLGGPTSGQGDAVVQYSIGDNGEPAPRQGAIEVSGERVEIRQEAAPETPEPPEPGPEPPAPTPPEPEPPTPEPDPPAPDPEPPPDCRFDIEPTRRDVAASGDSMTVAVETDAGCTWSAASRAGWITVVGGGSGSGPGSVTLAVGVNEASARTGTVDVAGRRFTVRQDAAPEQPEPEPPPPDPEPPPPDPDPEPPPPDPDPDPEPPPAPKPPECPYELSPTTYTASALGGGGTVEVITVDGCRWSATSDADWITIVGESRGTGSATITFRVDPFVSLTERTGTLTIAGRTFTVTQGLL